MAKGLVAAGADALAMPCNTAHHYAGAITSAVSVPFLDMVDLSVKKAAGPAGNGGTVGILASPAVRKIGLFNARFAAHGIRPIYPSDEAAVAGAAADAAAVLRLRSSTAWALAARARRWSSGRAW